MKNTPVILKSVRLIDGIPYVKAKLVFAYSHRDGDRNLYTPILICDSEVAVVWTEDPFFHVKKERIDKMAEFERSSGYDGYRCESGTWIYKEELSNRVIAMPENFNPIQLQLIESGQLKKDQELMVECKETKVEWLPVSGTIAFDDNNHVVLRQIEFAKIG